MPAYLLLVLAILTRVVPHHGWMNFTAVGGALLYFGARRSWREMLAPLAALMVTDYCLTVYAYHYPFAWTGYVTTWAWYLAVMVLGMILLKSRTTWLRVGAGVLLGPTSFFLISNYAVWVGGDHVSPDPRGARDVLCRRSAVLPQRPAFDGHCCGAGFRASGAGAEGSARPAGKHSRGAVNRDNLGIRGGQLPRGLPRLEERGAESGRLNCTTRGAVHLNLCIFLT